MKLDRKKNTSRNIIFGVIYKLYTILVPFLIRTVMIYTLGMEYIGLNSLFTSILQVLNMTELGVGIAMVFSMYKPIAEDDTPTICALMALYRKYYRVIGLVVVSLGVLVLPFLPHLIEGDIPPGVNLYVLYLLNLGATVLSYWLFSYKNSIISAHQRTDVLNKIQLGTSTVMYALQVASLLIVKDYYLYLCFVIFGQIATNIITAFFANKMYPQYKAKGRLPKENIRNINQKIRDLVTAKVGATIQNSLGMIIVSAFLGLIVLSKYNNYYFIAFSVFGFVSILFTSSMAGVGNSLVVNTKEENHNEFRMFIFAINWIACFCSICYLCLAQPFFALWVGEKNMLPFGIVICLAVNLYILISNQILAMYKDAAGVWRKDRFRPLVSALANLVISLTTVHFLGLYGVILANILSISFIGMPWMIKNIYSEIFAMSSKRAYKKAVINLFVFFLVGALTYLLCSLINFSSLPTLCIRLCICFVVPNVLLFLLYARSEELPRMLKFANKLCKNKLEKIKFLRRYLR